MLAWLEANPPATCASCAKPLETVLPGSGRSGRRRIWCSDACRQRAHRARKTTSSRAETEPDAPEPTPSTDHTLDECIVAVLESPHAVASVLDVVRRAHRDGRVDQPKYADLQVALDALLDEVTSNSE